MDFHLPGMNGIDALKVLRGDAATKSIPVIAVTSHAMVGDEIEARKAGCDDYLPKPIDENELLKKIRKFLD